MDYKPMGSPNLNGTLKKHRNPIPNPNPNPIPIIYRECLKNHAASIGGHALDGCGEFMPSPSSSSSVPSSLTCAACGCHRNFHRRLDHTTFSSSDQDSDDDDDDDDDRDRSGPRMLLALSTGAPVLPAGPGGSASATRKRHRSRFSPEQKERMQELSERLGWRMQRRDDAIIESCCNEIGVSKGVFKVWMHNNKHNFVSGLRKRGGDNSSSTANGANADGGGNGGGESRNGVNGSAAASSS